MFSQDLKVIIETDNKLGKPVCGNENTYKGSIMRKGSFHILDSNNDNNSTFRFVPEGDEYSRLKMLSKITLEPVTMLKREKDLLHYDLLKYRQESPQFEIWAKEIKKFKQFIMERANHFQVVPNYKELKLHTAAKSKILDSPKISEASRIIKKTISKSNLIALHNEEVPEEAENYKVDGTRRANDDDFSDLENLHSDLHSIKKFSFDDTHLESAKLPLLMELKKLSMDKKRPPESR